MHITVNELRELVMNRKGATFIAVVTDTEPAMKKTDNPYIGQVRHIARRNGMLGTSYENDVNNQRQREGNEERFHAESLWGGKGKHLGPNIVQHVTSGQEYLVVFQTRRDENGKPIMDEDRWLLNDRTVDKSMFAEFLKESTCKKQEVKKTIPWRTIKLENIRELKIDGKTYYVK